MAVEDLLWELDRMGFAIALGSTIVLLFLSRLAIAVAIKISIALAIRPFDRQLLA